MGIGTPAGFFNFLLCPCACGPSVREEMATCKQLDVPAVSIQRWRGVEAGNAPATVSSLESVHHGLLDGNRFI